MQIAGQATALASITTMSAMSAALATGTILMAVPGVSNSSAHDAMHCNARRWRAVGDARDAVESQLRTVGKQRVDRRETLPPGASGCKALAIQPSGL